MEEGHEQFSFLSNQLISTGLEPVLSHTEKSYIASYYKQFPTHIKIKNIKSISVLLARALGPSGLGAIITGFHLVIFHFNIHGTLSNYNNRR